MKNKCGGAEARNLGSEVGGRGSEIESLKNHQHRFYFRTSALPHPFPSRNNPLPLIATCNIISSITKLRRPTHALLITSRSARSDVRSVCPSRLFHYPFT